ncbi:MAG: hypothetical protein ABSE16_14195 [Verrucomicrobiota bacterium]|jgi:hypothetical protein
MAKALPVWVAVQCHKEMKGSSSLFQKLPAKLLVPGLLLGVLVVMLGGVFLPGHTLFANDGPLGRLMSQSHRMPGRIPGYWDDLNGIGLGGGALAPGISVALQCLLQPVWFSKLYAFLSLLILGLSAWCFFSQWRLARLACVLGSLAAMLNSSFFSVACWGVSAQVLTVAMVFLALAALARPGWRRLILAGLATGMGVIEGADVGAIFSVYVAVFMMYQAWLADGPRIRTLALGVGSLAIVAICAGLVASQAVFGLVGTNIEGVAGTEQNAQTKAQRWGWATAWSLPKKETLALFIPGLFGYRMDTPNGGGYWGAVGQSVEWERYLEGGQQGPPPEKGNVRYTGGGNYAGVLVILLGIWAVAESCRRNGSVFSQVQRRWLCFWLGVAVISLLLAFGRHAPFYRWLYALPYSSTIRNPVKFLAPMSVALVVLFAYGVDGLWRRYLQPRENGATAARKKAAPPPIRFGRFEKCWVAMCALAWGISLLEWWIYAGSRDTLESYLQTLPLKPPAHFSANMSSLVASFSIRQVGWFVILFALAAGLVAWILRGGFAGARAKWGGILLGTLLVVDLGWSNQPWVHYWNYVEKYATNPLLDILRQNPYEHRVAILPLVEPPAYALLERVYRLEWLQQQFPYYDIQSSDIVEMPRVSEDFKAFHQALQPTNDDQAPFLMRRTWELTDTRYLLGAAGFITPLNEKADPEQHRFHIVARFDIQAKPGATPPLTLDQYTTVPNEDGGYALFEFTGALPRAKLYLNWLTMSNNADVLPVLVSPSFHPAQTVMVTGILPPPVATNASAAEADPVQFVHYASRDMVLACHATAPTVLLLNSRFDPYWHVLIDGSPATLLRCNFIMRGVYLAGGTHTVEFRYQPPTGLLYFSLAAMGVLLLVVGISLGFQQPVRQSNDPQSGVKLEHQAGASAPRKLK